MKTCNCNNILLCQDSNYHSYIWKKVFYWEAGLTRIHYRSSKLSQRVPNHFVLSSLRITEGLLYVYAEVPYCRSGVKMLETQIVVFEDLNCWYRIPELLSQVSNRRRPELSRSRIVGNSVLWARELRVHVQMWICLGTYGGSCQERRKACVWTWLCPGAAELSLSTAGAIAVPIIQRGLTSSFGMKLPWERGSIADSIKATYAASLVS
jgi:hypothetical protein